MFQRESCSLDVMDVGVAPLSYVLVHPLGVGNQPRRSSSCSNFLAHAGFGRERRMEAMAGIWTAVGHFRVDQHFPAFISSSFRAMGLVPAMEAWKIFFRGHCSSVAGLRGVHYPLDCPEPSSLRTACIYSIQLRRGVAARQRPRCKRYMDGILASMYR